MGEGTSEIRHLRERVILHDDMLRAIGERIRLLDEMVHGLQALVAGGPVGAGEQETAGAKGVATGRVAPPAPPAAIAPEPRRAPVVRRR